MIIKGLSIDSPLAVSYLSFGNILQIHLGQSVPEPVLVTCAIGKYPAQFIRSLRTDSNGQLVDSADPCLVGIKIILTGVG